MADPLEALVIDERETDRAALSAAIHEYVAITTSGELRLLPPWERLGARGRVITGLLASKAACLLGKRDREGLTPTELSVAAGIPIGTAKRELRELAAQRVIGQDSASRYFVAGVNIVRAAEYIREVKP